jgi:hypothetical protein
MYRDGNDLDRGRGGYNPLNTALELRCVLCKSLSVQLIYNRKVLTARRCERLQYQYWAVLAIQMQLKRVQRRVLYSGMKFLAQRSYG